MRGDGGEIKGRWSYWSWSCLGQRPDDLVEDDGIKGNQESEFESKLKCDKSVVGVDEAGFLAGAEKQDPSCWEKKPTQSPSVSFPSLWGKFAQNLSISSTKTHSSSHDVFLLPLPLHHPPYSPQQLKATDCCVIWLLPTHSVPLHVQASCFLHDLLTHPTPWHL